MLRADTLARRIRSGAALPSAAIRRPDAFDALTTNPDGKRLPLLGSSAKIDAGGKVGIFSRVLYMVPANLSGKEACAWRSEGCTAACLAESVGHMSRTTAQAARRWRHGAFYADTARFLSQLCDEVAAHERAANRKGKVPAIRLCGTVDIPFHRMRVKWKGASYPNIHAAFPNVRFYEYTKRPLSQQGTIPPNLHFTFSVSERPDSEAHALAYLEAGYGAAVVMNHKRHFPPAFWAVGGGIFPVVDGDAHDARFLDPPGVVVALAAKGRAKRDESGFVRKVNA